MAWFAAALTGQRKSGFPGRRPPAFLTFFILHRGNSLLTFKVEQMLAFMCLIIVTPESLTVSGYSKTYMGVHEAESLRLR
jgi:hypothetical protein